MFRLFSIIILFFGFSFSLQGSERTFVPDVDHQVFRNEIIRFVHYTAENNQTTLPRQGLNELDAKWSNFYQKTDWSVKISVYHKGNLMGEAHAHGSHLADTLEQATKRALNGTATPITPLLLKQCRFKVTFDYYPAKLYSFIEYQDQGVELVGSRVAVRTLDMVAINQQIKSSQRYLLNAIDPQWHGIFKFYNAEQDKPDDLLRTVYSASTLYTLLKLYAFNHDPLIQQQIEPIADFILSNQLKEGPNAGGFYYGFNPKKNKPTCLVVVGTTSKTIFTLLELHRLYNNQPRYLQAAIKAGNWLVKMVKPDGKVIPIARCNREGWQYSTNQSLLYSGQVLSALSRLYLVTHDSQYQIAATKIANSFIQKIKTKGWLLGDDYRPSNSISTSWVMMSLMDFAAINQGATYRNAIEQLASTILSRQVTNKADVYSNGRYLDAMTSSGNGWINEVMGVYYPYCLKNKFKNCQRVKYAMVLTSRWLLQNAYTLENTYNIQNPQRAIGGFITNFTTKTVRTDAVCHGVNSLLSLQGMMGQNQQQLVKLPESPLRETIPLLRSGNGFIF